VIIVLKADVTEKQIEHVIERVESLGLRPHLSRGTYRTIVGVIGDEEKLRTAPLQAIPGVADVLPILPPYKLASNEAHPEPSIVEVAGVKIGGGHLAMIAGPCAVESAERMDAIAAAIKQAGANLLRGGAFKPRTSPYAYQGMGEEGLKILRETGDKHALPIVTEVMDPRRVELVDRYTDMFQIGARNMQNFTLLTEVGQTRKPVLLKRGMSATVKDMLMSAEYILAEGNHQVILCERGVRSFEDSTRNMLDLSAVPNKPCNWPAGLDSGNGPRGRGGGGGRRAYRST
jgi:3-deoxy-7-phosphoheptulonate synthase